MKIDQLLHEGISNGVYPGAVFLVARADELLFFNGCGQTNFLTGQPVTIETVYDLASLTKPLSTALVLMHLVQDGRLTLTTRIADILPGFDGSDKKKITVEYLLCHTSGYPDYQPYFKILNQMPHGDRSSQLKVLLTKEPLLAEPGDRMCYSDLGFMVLAWVVEAICKKSLPVVAREKIYQPLRLKGLFFPDCEPAPSHVEFAATEDCPWRRQTLVGTVHDDNASSVKDLLGHAGLFGDALSVYQLLGRLLQTYHGEAEMAGISTAVVRQFLTPCQAGGRVKGFDTPAAVDSACGHYFSKKTIGHLGFTGTSFWMDLKNRIISVLLTNRVHPSRKNEAIKAFRPRLHDCAMQHLSLSSDTTLPGLQ